MHASNSEFLDFNDLLFENRNKAYGAYFIRKTYDESVVKALFLSISILILIVVIPVIYNQLFPERKVITPIVNPEGTIVKPIDFKIEGGKVPPGGQGNTIPVAVINNLTDNDSTPPNVANGSNDTGTISGAVSGGGGGVRGNDSIPYAPPVIPEDKDIEFPDIMPSFPGGEAKLQEFLQKHIELPEDVQSLGIQGIIYLRLKIDKEGKLDDIELMKGIGWGCDEAAIKALKKIPRWNPAQTKGKAVPVKFVIPVRIKFGN